LRTRRALRALSPERCALAESPAVHLRRALAEGSTVHLRGALSKGPTIHLRRATRAEEVLIRRRVGERSRSRRPIRKARARPSHRSWKLPVHHARRANIAGEGAAGASARKPLARYRRDTIRHASVAVDIDIIHHRHVSVTTAVSASPPGMEALVRSQRKPSNVAEAEAHTYSNHSRTESDKRHSRRAPEMPVAEAEAARIPAPAVACA